MKTVPTRRVRNPVNAFFSFGFSAEAVDGVWVTSADVPLGCGVGRGFGWRFGEVLKNLRQPRCFRVMSS